MADLIKMDLYRMFSSRAFKVSLIIVTIVSFLSKPINKILTDSVAGFMQKIAEEGGEVPEGSLEALTSIQTVTLSSILISPFGYSLLMIVALISVVTFAYADTAGGFIKNFAGQIPKRGDSIISKFAAIGVHNVVFFCCALAGSIAGEAVTRTIVIDGGISEAAATFLLKILLFQSLSVVLLFFAAGIKQKTLASIAGVVFGSGMLGLAYLGLDNIAKNVFGISGLNIGDYAPDQLVSSSGNIAALSSLIVSAAVIAVFITLTVKVFNARDVK